MGVPLLRSAVTRQALLQTRLTELRRRGSPVGAEARGAGADARRVAARLPGAGVEPAATERAAPAPQPNRDIGSAATRGEQERVRGESINPLHCCEIHDGR